MHRSLRPGSFARAVVPLAAVAASMWTAAPACARIVEEQFELPVEVVDAYGKKIAQAIQVTLVRDDAAAAPQPLLILNHGRAPEAPKRAELSLVPYLRNARWFVQRGFVVALPVRVGYGASGGEDVEDSGPCNDKRYPPGYAAAAQQTLQLERALQQREFVAKGRSVVIGQSYGGTTAVAVAAMNPPGVVAAINFAGGGGGNPKTQPERPCAPNRLEAMFGKYGATAKVPMLWVYTENDQYFGPTYPKEWFEAFRKAGGDGEFVQFPPHGSDGHPLFTSFPQVWRPVVVEFLRKQGFEMKAPKEAVKEAP